MYLDRIFHCSCLLARCTTQGYGFLSGVLWSLERLIVFKNKRSPFLNRNSEVRINNMRQRCMTNPMNYVLSAVSYYGQSVLPKSAAKNAS